MRRSAGAILAWVACSGIAYAQAPAAAPQEPSRGYVEGVGQAAFGNVTSQSFGAELGFTIRPELQVFVDGGLVRDAATADLSAGATRIAADISSKAGGGDFRVKQPVTFGIAGIKYLIPVQSARAQPYVMVGGGAAQVKKDVTFTVAHGSLSDYVTLGTDLSGSQTKGMVGAGAGISVALTRWIVADLGYRFGRVFTSEGVNVNRVGLGVGVRF